MTVYIQRIVGQIPVLRLSPEQDMWKQEIEKWAGEISRTLQDNFYDVYKDTTQGKMKLVEYPSQPSVLDLEEGQMALFMKRIFVNIGGEMWTTARLSKVSWTILPCSVTVP